MSGIFESLEAKLILASASPRRRELLSHLGYPFEVIVSAIEEKRQSHEEPEAYVLRNAREKAAAVLLTQAAPESCLVIGSDTIGVMDGHVLEKPCDAADAKRMLGLMAGRSHEVLTGLAVAQGRGTALRIEQIVVRTSVQFKSLSEREIAYYVATGEPLDKAGAYGIQGIGGFMVESIDGSYSNVVGLPLVELTALLRRFSS